MPLCTQDDVEKLLQIDFGNNPDDSVTQYIAQATAAITNYCHQSLEFEAGIVETFEADQPTAWHVLDRFPVSAVASVVEDDYTLTVDDEYVWYSDGRLRRVSGQFDWVWSEYVDAVVVTYSAGYGVGAAAPYVDVPDDVVLACASFAAALFRHGAAFAAHGTAGPAKSVTLDGSDAVAYDTTVANMQLAVDAPGLSEGQKMLLAPYVRRNL